MKQERYSISITYEQLRCVVIKKISEVSKTGSRSVCIGEDILHWRCCSEEEYICSCHLSNFCGWWYQDGLIFTILMDGQTGIGKGSCSSIPIPNWIVQGQNQNFELCPRTKVEANEKLRGVFKMLGAALYVTLTFWNGFFNAAIKGSHVLIVFSWSFLSLAVS